MSAASAGRMRSRLISASCAVSSARVRPNAEGFPHKDGPFGAKGVGVASTIGIAAAIGNAIFDATGRRIKDLPITWDRMLEALEGREGGHGTF